MWQSLISGFTSPRSERRDGSDASTAPTSPRMDRSPSALRLFSSSSSATQSAAPASERHHNPARQASPRQQHARNPSPRGFSLFSSSTTQLHQAAAQYDAQYGAPPQIQLPDQPITIVSVTKGTISDDLALAISRQQIQVEEMRKTRIQDLIRRDITFPQIYQDTVAGNDSRDCANRYAPLFDSYKSIYKIYIFDDKKERERIKTEKRNRAFSYVGDGADKLSGSGSGNLKDVWKAEVKEKEAALQQKLAITDALERMMAIAQPAEDAAKNKLALERNNQEIASLELRLSELKGVAFGLKKNAQAIEDDILWAKSQLESKEIADELRRMQQKIRVRNEQKILISGGKRAVLGQAEPQVVTWESKSEAQLQDLFGSIDHARRIQTASPEYKASLVKRLHMQVIELGKQEKDIAFHYAFCTEILKRASDLQNMEDLVSRLKTFAVKHKKEYRKDVKAQIKKEKAQEAKRLQAAMSLDTEESGNAKPADEKTKPTEEPPKPTEPEQPAKHEEASPQVWSFNDLMKKEKVPEPAPKIAAPPSHISHLKMFLSTSSGGSLYRIKAEDSYKVAQLVQEEEEAENNQLRRASVSAGDEDEPAASPRTEVKTEEPAAVVGPLENAQQVTTKKGSKKQAKTNDGSKPKRKKKDDELIEVEIDCASIPQETFQLLAKQQSRMLPKFIDAPATTTNEPPQIDAAAAESSPEKPTERIPEETPATNESTPTIVTPTAETTPAERKPEQPEFTNEKEPEKEENREPEKKLNHLLAPQADWQPRESSDKIYLTISKAGRRRARRKRKEAAIQQKMDEEEQREQLLETVMQRVAGHPVETDEKAVSEEGQQEDAKELWDFWSTIVV